MFDEFRRDDTFFDIWHNFFSSRNFEKHGRRLRQIQYEVQHGAKFFPGVYYVHFN